MIQVRGRLGAPLFLLLIQLAVGSGAAAAPDIEARVAAEYPAILAHWADGETDRAIDELDSLERSLVRPNKAERDVERLWRAKLGIIRETIQRSSVEVLVPLMVLHHDAYLHYVETGASVLAAHSRVMSAELAEFYAENSSEPRATLNASDLLTSLAGHLQSGQMMHRSASLFARALDLEPSNAAAHVGLGALYEWRGQPKEAAEHYATATRIEPAAGEALLRYGICAARQGEYALAEEQFDRALALGEPDWVVKVAFQEKARLQEDPGEAARVAREGREHFPASSRHAIQLAFMLERQRRSGSALEVLADLTEEAEPESERYRYARWPSSLLEAVRDRLRRTAVEQSAVLTDAAHGPAGMTPSE